MSDTHEWRWVGKVRVLAKHVNDVWIELRDARISILVIAAGVAALCLSQGLDVVRDLADHVSCPDGAKGCPVETGRIVRWAAFLIMCVLSGLSAWYWPLILRGSRTAEAEPRWFRWVRRLLGLAPLSAASVAIFVTGRHSPEWPWVPLVLFLITTAALLFFFVKRPELKKRLGDGSWWNSDDIWLTGYLRKLGLRHDPKFTNGDVLFVAASFLASFVALGLAWIPVARTVVATEIGAAAIAFSAVGSIIGLVSVLLLVLFGTRLPVIALGLILVILFSGWNDNHRLEAISTDPVSGRPTLDQAFDAYDKQHLQGPIILVATAGGASRAAYWTAAVLRALDDQTDGRFGRQVFAISSVSGGTLGAVGYAAWLSTRPKYTVACRYDTDSRLRFDQQFDGGDYLSPAVAGLVYADMFSSFLPVGWMPDRAASLEEAWERGYANALDAANDGAMPCTLPAKGADTPDPAKLLTRDFRDIWQNSLSGEGPWVPIVLANGTLVETGKRMITAPIHIDTATFLDSYDFFDKMGALVSASTAILNSARFPIVSPAGSIPYECGNLHLVDGGYFENGGLETIYDVARALRRRLVALHQEKRPILIIEINNDPESAMSKRNHDDLLRAANHPGGNPGISVTDLGVADPDPRAIRFGSGVTSILGGLYAPRGSRAVLAAKQVSLAGAVGLDNTYHATFNLGPVLDKRVVAMSWLLSSSSRDAMDQTFGGPGRKTGLTLERSEKTHVDCERAAILEIASSVDHAHPKAQKNARCGSNVSGADEVGYPINIPVWRGEGEDKALPSSR